MSYHNIHVQFVRIMLTPYFATVMVMLLWTTECHSGENDHGNFMSVHGAVNNSQTVCIEDLMVFPPFHINNVSRLKETGGTGEEAIIGVFNYGGVLLRDILEKAGMKYKRKWEPLVFVRIRGIKGKEVVFSFGEIFNSRLDNNIVIAIKKENQMLGPTDGFAMSVVGEDSTGGRSVKRIQKMEIY